jgi:hypothetical protein
MTMPERAGRHGRPWRFRRVVFVMALAVSAFEAGAIGRAGASTALQITDQSSGSSKGGNAPEPQVCDGCVPPLAYTDGGLVLTEAGGLTVTPIYWEPSGGKYNLPAGYEDIINGYITNVAAASGSTNNVYSVDTEYSQNQNGTKTAITYKIKAGTPVVDTTDLPNNGCPVDSGYTACITDAQLRTELSAVTSSQKLPTDLSHFYPVFLPPGVEAMDADGTTSASTFCGYHRAFGLFLDQTVYGDLPYAPGGGGCDAGQAPNGNLPADGMVSTLSHELNEAITDPLSQVAWNDQTGHEIGDMCAQNYGPPLGSTDPSNPESSEYNQVINGAKYYTQTEFSNKAFAANGIGKGCAQSEALARGAGPNSGSAQGSTTTGSASGGAATNQARKVGSVFADAFPNTLPADGSSTSDILVTVADAAGTVVVGDHVHFSVGLEEGTGRCGTLSSTDKATDQNGQVRVTYTVSKDNAACWVMAVEAGGGQSAQSVIYQGSSQADADTLKDTFPTSLKAGGSPTTFTITATNPTAQPVPDAALDFVIFAGSSKSPNLDASQVHLSYSATGPTGTFSSVPLDGSTANGDDIEAYVGSQRGATLAPRSSQTYTFEVSLASNVHSASPLISLEGYLDQINTASGSGATVADTLATDINVPSSPSGLSTGWYILIAVGGAVILALVGFVLWRRHKGHRQTPTAGAPA